MSTPALLLRRATVADLPAIMALEEASFPSPWPESVIRKDLVAQPEARYWVLLAGEETVAYLGGWLYEDEFHIGTVATAPERRRRGLGEVLLTSVLLAAAAEGADWVVLEYRVGNAPAAGLYAKLGFAPTRLRRRYYTDTGEDAQEVVLEGLAEARERLTERRRETLARHGCELHVEP